MSFPGIDIGWLVMLVMVGLLVFMLFWGIQFVMHKWLKRSMFAWLPLGASTLATVGFAIARFGFETELSVLRLELPLFGGMSMPWTHACLYGLILAGAAAAGCLAGTILARAMQKE